MTRRTRHMLQEQFLQGKMPTEEDFSDLIGSMLNMLDEGFDKTPEAGFKVAQLRDGKLMSFYKDINIGSPLWSFGLGKSNDNLSILDARNQALLTLSSITGTDDIHRTAIGIRQINPQHELDVAGCIASYARVGHNGELAVPADGNWYDITDTMTGCQAWEVMAGVGAKDNEGRYALTHAFALNAFNDNGSIDYHQTHFGNKCSRIELRWMSEGPKESFEFKLQMRVGCSYGDDVWIKYHMTQLWLDTLMLESDQKPLRQPSPQYDVKGKVKK
ncbi:hypothetical protein [Solimicrobium silvestre]|uniref:Uncharacterized protein n=1 Tax=Solimicrobium silvestre TaxID=2099400 RepID=A0A2S9H0E7_9BURK|nr:hypothetical protein [Solimicrobium silvestre]PRC93451.1 hypothetical protein S2091_1838 [Solimicrobium silvestre]